MKYAITLFIVLLFIPLVHSDTTFFDNPDDVFIIGNSPTSEVIIEETIGGTKSRGSCLYKWNCTNWTECIFGKQTRNCTNIGTCSDNYKVPEMTRSCMFHFETNGKIVLGYIKNENLVYILLAIFGFTILLFILLFIKKKKQDEDREKKIY